MPAPIAQIATQALSKNGLTSMHYRVNNLNNNRIELKTALQSLNSVVEIFPTTGNFLLVRFKDSAKIFNAFADDGIIMRDFANKDRLENCIRITIGSKSEMHSTIATLEKID